MESTFMTILGLYIITSSVWSAIIVFGGHKDAPRGLKIAIGIGNCLALLSLLGFAMNS